MTGFPPTVADIRAAHWREPVRAAYERPLLMNTYVFRPVSFFLTWAAIRVGLRSETVSWLSGIVGLAGCAVLLIPDSAALPLGLALLWLFNLLDCVDGDLARTLRAQNAYGRFVDSVCGGVVDIAFWAVVGGMAYQHPDVLHWREGFGYGTQLWIAVGALTCFAYLIIELIERAFEVHMKDLWMQATGRGLSTTDDERPTRARWIIRIVQRNVRVRETHYALLVVACLTGTVDLLLVAYLLYYTIHACALLVIYRRRGVTTCLAPQMKAPE